jgi:hypothetical protein
MRWQMLKKTKSGSERNGSPAASAAATSPTNSECVRMAFALAAAVWTVNEKRAASAFSHRPKVVAPVQAYYGGYRRRWRRRW